MDEKELIARLKGIYDDAFLNDKLGDDLETSKIILDIWFYLEMKGAFDE